MIIIYIYYHIFMNLYILLVFFFVDFTLQITLQCMGESATSLSMDRKNSSRISTNKLREFVRKKNSKWICDI